MIRALARAIGRRLGLVSFLRAELAHTRAELAEARADALAWRDLAERSSPGGQARATAGR